MFILLHSLYNISNTLGEYMRIRPLLFIPISLVMGASLYASQYSFSMSADTTKFDYAETGSTGLLDTETNDFGAITGYTLNLEPRWNGFYIGGSYARGNTDYIGGTNLNPSYGSHRTTTQNTITDYSAGFKSTAVIDPRMEIPIKFGLGYRGWLREIQSTATVSGYDELYEWGYFDFGIGLHYMPSPNVSVGIDTNYRKAYNAQMYENWHGYTFKLKDVYGYKITVPIEYTLTPSISSFVMYNYEYWSIGASDAIGGYYEPDSKTKNEIFSIGLKFRF